MSKNANIASFFKETKKAESVSKDPARVSATLSVLTSIEPSSFLKEFFETLSPSQRLAHEIAKEKLGTSYDVERTHDYKAYLSKK